MNLLVGQVIHHKRWNKPLLYLGALPAQIHVVWDAEEEIHLGPDDIMEDTAPYLYTINNMPYIGMLPLLIRTTPDTELWGYTKNGMILLTDKGIGHLIRPFVMDGEVLLRNGDIYPDLIHGYDI